MEKFAVRMTYPSGYSALVTSGNHFGKSPAGQSTPPVAPFYSQIEAAEFMARCRANPGNEHFLFTVEPYPENPYDNR